LIGLKKKIKKQKAYPIILRSYSLAPWPLATTTESTLLFIPAVALDLLNEELEQEEEDDDDVDEDEEAEAVAKEPR
jgi:hypothetical protein